MPRSSLSLLVLAALPILSCDPQPTQPSGGPGEPALDPVTATAELRYAPRFDPDNFVRVVDNPYFPLKPGTRFVYFGEEVDIYKDGRIVNHEGSWAAGVNSARFGLMMPGPPMRGSRYYQEQAPRLAMDRARILSVTEQVTTPAGTFGDCLKIEETTPLEPKLREYKYYAPGIGLVQDGSLKLVRFGSITGG